MDFVTWKSSRGSQAGPSKLHGSSGSNIERAQRVGSVLSTVSVTQAEDTIKRLQTEVSLMHDQLEAAKQMLSTCHAVIRDLQTTQQEKAGSSPRAPDLPKTKGKGKDPMPTGALTDVDKHLARLEFERDWYRDKYEELFIIVQGNMAKTKDEKEPEGDEAWCD